MNPTTIRIRLTLPRRVHSHRSVGSVTRVDPAVDVIEGAYVYRLDGVVVPIDETFYGARPSWSSRRAAAGVTIEVAATCVPRRGADQAVVRWRSDGRDRPRGGQGQ